MHMHCRLYENCQPSDQQKIAGIWIFWFLANFMYVRQTDYLKDWWKVELWRFCDWKKNFFERSVHVYDILIFKCNSSHSSALFGINIPDEPFPELWIWKNYSQCLIPRLPTRCLLQWHVIFLHNIYVIFKDLIYDFSLPGWGSFWDTV